MASIFPVGGKKWNWFHKTAQPVDVEVEGEPQVDVEIDPNFEAVKDLPIFDESPVLPEAAPVATDMTDVPAVPAPEMTPEEAKTVKEEVKDVADAAKDVAQKAEELAVKVEECACETKEGEPAKGKEEDSVTIEILDDEAPKSDEAPKEESKPEEKMEKESKDECKDDKAPKAECKPEEKPEKEACASAKPEFVRLSHTTSQTKEEIRKYWLALGFPAEYVNAMAKDYD